MMAKPGYSDEDRTQNARFIFWEDMDKFAMKAQAYEYPDKEEFKVSGRTSFSLYPDYKRLPLDEIRRKVA